MYLVSLNRKVKGKIDLIKKRKERKKRKKDRLRLREMTKSGTTVHDECQTQSALHNDIFEIVRHGDANQAALMLSTSRCHKHS